MNERHRPPIGLLKLFDFTVVVFVFLLTTALIVKAEHGISLSRFLAMRTRIVDFGIFVLELSVCHVIFQACGLYRSRRLSRRSAEVVDVLKSMTSISVCFVAFSFLFSIQMITIRFVTIFWVLSSLILAIGRLGLRFIAARLRVHGKDLRYMLILGTNSRAVEFARRISANPGLGYRLLGLVDDDWPGLLGIEGAPFSVVSDCAGLAEFLRKNIVDEVAIYLPVGSFYRRASEIVTLCQLHGITLRFNPDIFGLKSTYWCPEELDGNQYIATYTGSSESWPQIVKRLIDIAGASFALLLLSPLLACAALAIRLTSAGPILFRQERIGLNKRRFHILKFRTMVPDAERLLAGIEKQNEMSGPVFKIRNDPRITPIGKLLRKSSIDELPQLFNVLVGDMSLVGPRPLPIRDYDGFNEDWQRRRFSTKPGITCLWQIGGRNEITFDQWMLLDLQYLDEWSLWLDLKILAKTVPAVLRGTGAA
jgi:exopolysaccharide biosynthesis polyprenyl glycosylphosphotransferase